jgi:hypothetical protein
MLLRRGAELGAERGAELGAESDPLPSSTGPSVRGLGVLSASGLEPGSSVLHAAAMHIRSASHCEAVLAWLVERGADINDADSEGCTPLDRAGWAGAPRALLEASCDVNLLVRQFVGLALEFKNPNGTGRVSPAQAAWHDALRRERWAVYIVKSAEEAWNILIGYLSGGTT